MFDNIYKATLWTDTAKLVASYRVAAAITQFASGSTKYFSIYHAESPKPKRDPA